ncbi:restriction endonuclease subunit S [Nocardioides sp. NPDC058538]|uniref:restriction endonuclease subunit S n=1 Tax=Nocardioides sp. NPDC058538 TaxID=3346542 RepID=UPI0036654D69
MKTTLSEVCTITMGQAPVGDSYNDRGEGLPLIAGAGDFDGLRISPKKFTTAPGKISAAGDIVLSIRASIGAKVWADGEYCLGRGVAGLRPKTELDSNYLWHWLAHAEPTLAAKGRGATFLQVNRRDIGELDLELPSVHEQRRIAMILDQADAIRIKRRQILTHLDTLTQSIFHDMFGKAGAESAPLADIAEIWDCPHSTPKWSEDGEICLRTPNLIRGGWNWDDTRYVDEVQFAKRSKGGGAEPGDIILSREGTVGIAAVVESGMRVCMGQRLVQVRPDLGVVHPEYLLEFLLTALDPARIAHVMVGSTAQHLNVKDLRALAVPVASLESQRHFATQKSAVDRRRSAVQRALVADDELFASLQFHAFKGEL